MTCVQLWSGLGGYLTLCGVTVVIFDISEDQHGKERPSTARKQRWEVIINKYTTAQRENSIPVREFNILEPVGLSKLLIQRQPRPALPFASLPDY